MSSVIIDEMHGSGQVQFGQDGMTATRLARCSWQNWPTAVVQLMGIPVFTNGFMQIIGRQTYPGIPQLQVDSINVEGMGKMTQSSWGSGPLYEFGKLSINYTTREEEDNQDQNGQPGTYLIESLDYSVEVAVIPVVVVDEADKEKLAKDAEELLRSAPSSNPDGSPAPIPNINLEPKKKTVKRHIRIPTITYGVTIPQVFNLPAAAIRNNVGKLNKKAMFGGAPGTVLFDGPNAERESAFFSRRYWRVSYKFLYQQFGWNNQLHPDTLKWVPAKALGSDNDPYEYADMQQLFPFPYRITN